MTKQTQPKVGRKPKPTKDIYIQTNTRLHPRVRDQLETMAKAQGMTLSAYLRVMAEERVCFSQSDATTHDLFRRIVRGETVTHPKFEQDIAWRWLVATGER